MGSYVNGRRGICYGIVQPGKEVANGVPLIRVKDFDGGTLSLDSAKRVAPDIEASYSRSRLEGGEILLSLVGTLGLVAVAPSSAAGCNVARAVGVIPAEPGAARYLSLCLRSGVIQRYIHRWATTTVQATFNLRDVKRLPIPQPPLDEQRRIAAVLGALDDKIELNRKMKRTLEAMAQALFKSWFIDFDGVPDSELVESELGPIPKGWEVGTIGEQFNLTMGLSPPGHTYNEDGVGMPFFQGARDFGFRFPAERVYCTAPKRTAEALDTLISVRAPVGRPNIAWRACCIGRGVAALRHNGGSRSYTFAMAKHLEHQFEKFNAEGTVFGSINKRDFLKLTVVVPPPEMVQRFDATVAPLDNRIRNATFQARTLAALRDALLPKLISGEIRVPEAEAVVEAAL